MNIPPDSFVEAIVHYPPPYVFMESGPYILVNSCPWCEVGGDSDGPADQFRTQPWIPIGLVNPPEAVGVPTLTQLPPPTLGHPIPAVPEPSTWALLLLGMFAVSLLRTIRGRRFA